MGNENDHGKKTEEESLSSRIGVTRLKSRELTAGHLAEKDEEETLEEFFVLTQSEDVRDLYRPKDK